MDSTDLPVLWLRADRTPDSAWKDVTGHGYDGAFFGQGPRQHVLLNYNPAIWFNGADDSVRIPYNLDSLTEMTYIAVFVPADTGEAAVWGTSGALLRNTWMTTHRVNGPDSTADTVITSGKMAVLSTVLQSWRRNDSLSPSQTGCLLFGAAGTVAPFKGALAELLVFDRSLDVLTQIQYETYLAIKYGIPLTKGNYVSAGQTVLWNADKNKKYAWRVTGLGREDYFSLHQKQAVSAIDADSLLVVSNGDPQTSNAANADSLTNGNYLVWGDNNKALTVAATPDSQLQLMNRSWLMNVSGAGARTMTTTVRVNKKDLPSSPNGYWLVVNPGEYPYFPVDSLLYHLPDSISGDTLVYYRRVRWDADGSGKDLFGLAQARDLLLKLRVLDSPTCANPMLGKVLLSAVGGQSPYSYRVMNSTGQVMASGSFVDSTAGNAGAAGASGAAAAGSSGGSTAGASVGNLSMGKYSILLTDAQGHQSLRTLTMVVPQSQYLNIGLGSDEVLPKGGQTYLDASRYVSAGAAQAYQWTGDNGFHATTPVVAVSEPGRYSVVVTSTAGCVFRDSVNVTGAAQQYVAIYPSPSVDGNFTISISLPQAGEVSVGIYDLNGNVVQQMAGQQNTEYRFTGHISTPGVYMISVKTPKGIESHKLLVL